MILARYLVCVSPFVTVLVALGWFASKGPWYGEVRTATFLGFLLPGFTFYGLGRSDWAHLLPLYSVSVPFVTILAHDARASSKERRHETILRRAVLPLISIAALRISAGRTKDYLTARPIPLERVLGIVFGQDDSNWLVRATDDLRRGTGPIFVACERHDRIFINAIGLYFLSGRPSGTYFSQLDPGIATTELVQKRIIADLQRNNVQTVFVWHLDVYEPNLSSTSSGCSWIRTCVILMKK